MADGSYRTHCAHAVYKTALEDAPLAAFSVSSNFPHYQPNPCYLPPSENHFQAHLGRRYIYFIPLPSENSRHMNTNRSPGNFIDSSLNQTHTSIFLMSQKTVLMLFKKVVL